jgi:hypothetical protein
VSAEQASGIAVDDQAPGEAPQPLTLNHPASSPGRISGRGSSLWVRGKLPDIRKLAGLERLAPQPSGLAEDQVIAMDHLRATGKAENGVDVGG